MAFSDSNKNSYSRGQPVASPARRVGNIIEGKTKRNLRRCKPFHDSGRSAGSSSSSAEDVNILEESSMESEMSKENSLKVMVLVVVDTDEMDADSTKDELDAGDLEEDDSGSSMESEHIHPSDPGYHSDIDETEDMTDTSSDSLESEHSPDVLSDKDQMKITPKEETNTSPTKCSFEETCQRGQRDMFPDIDVMDDNNIENGLSPEASLNCEDRELCEEDRMKTLQEAAEPALVAVQSRKRRFSIDGVDEITEDDLTYERSDFDTEAKILSLSVKLPNSTAVDCKITSTSGEKHFDKSPTKARHPRKIDLRARYWAFLFDNLRRAVDEIYVTCESDQSVVECKEVLMMLDYYVRDFKALIDWIQLQEKLEKTDAQSRCQLGRQERKDAEGWETVQRGRPVRPRSTAAMPRASLVTETLRSKDDSDKENVCLLPGERTPKGDLIEDRPSVAEPLSKDSPHSSDRPLAERTQFTVSIFDDVKNSGSSQDSSVNSSEIRAIHNDAVCLAIPQQVTTALPTDKDRVLAEKAGLVNETDPSDISNVSAADLSMAEVLAKKEELADRLEKANEEAIASAIAEEEQLTREIEAEENNDINIETDNDSDFSASMGSGSLSFCGISMDWNDVLADYEARESWRQNTSWGDIVEEEPARLPGHGIHMHEKLSSPSRKRTIAESKKKYEEKHMKAQQLREKLREEKTLKLQKLLEREKDVRKWKEELLDQRRRMMEEKLLHAEFKREVQLQAIVKKAQEEEAKVNEIAFINTLEAQNKRHDVLSKLKEYEQRLNELQEERQRRQEEKQARDEAVQERKRALEAERQARVEELLMKRKEQEARIEQQRQEKEKAREDAARERARDREERLAALTAAQQEAMEELQKKIQLKHDESIRRHMEQIEQRKEKAAELSSGRHASTDYAPKLTPYERKKQCSLCNVPIASEVYLFSHIKGKKHQQAVRENSSIQGRELSDEEVEHLSLKKYVVDIVIESAAPSEPVKDGEERQKNKKKAKKIKARMNSRAKEYESLVETKNSGSDSPYKAKLQRLAKDLVKQLQVQDSGSWANNKASALDRTLGEIARILEKEVWNKPLLPNPCSL
ncbi:S phase cyclin A-associated protein in the endoplasmic reticulum [Microtus ochrogaster]|uniref:S phase cyclin A-associated protein in the endoplasmic reticulum n=1 Tax=Microtus ochrogaster TaxID=79684 RepID=A0A8J6GEW5_MICOH|nr:S phase cyclin A-associated protein in the endoplasmic reticulum [Microtus ochrogaster]